MTTHNFAETKSAAIGRRRVLRPVIAGLCLIAAAGTPAVAQTAADAGPTAPIQRLDAALLTAMKAGQNEPFTQRFAALAPVIEDTFDLHAVLTLSIGPAWPTLPSAEKPRMTAAFQRYTVATYAANFNSYNGQSFQISPSVRPVGNGEVIVDTNIVRNNGSKVQLNYVMRHDPDGWKVVDVQTSGISRVAVQHSDFGSLLLTGGAPALTAALQQKVSTLSGGTLA